MKILCITILASSCYAGTFNVDFQASHLPIFGFDGSLTTTVSHTYDDETFRLVASDWSWSADTLTRTITQDVLIVSSIFPDPPVFETRSITETINIRNWVAFDINDINVSYVAPYFDTQQQAWLFGFDLSGELVELEPILIDRVFIGPFSTYSDTVTLTGKGSLRPVRNKLVNGEWEPEPRSHLTRNIWEQHRTTPRVSVDGVSMGGWILEAKLPIVIPEPSSSGLLGFLIFPVIARRLRSGPAL